MSSRTRAAGPRSAPPGGEPVWHDLECGAYRADLPLWRELVAESCRRTGSVCEALEIGCGTGRVSLALAGPDCHVTAIDVDPDLVAVLRRRARERDAPVEAVAADARSLDLGRAFDLILAPMQVAQLVRGPDRARMLDAIARHLRPGGLAALALLELGLDEEWEAGSGITPAPDVLETADWRYSSQPVAVRRTDRGRALELERVRRAVSSSSGAQLEEVARVSLELVSAGRLEQEAARAGLRRGRRRRIGATRDHVASTVVLLRHGRG